ncbi:hypothetical protein KIPB_008535 [Kipferlia bialata]|uniref:Uncharacterized protein n=1 Tax=Kipferlia bialata TaxID=797122 RepID=A0A9K3D3J3_9EUKA|nr:hypothetical protein KIPB_008535 [Kipferlia bialata]|eukprot:g8535.t1
MQFRFLTDNVYHPLVGPKGELDIDHLFPQGFDPSPSSGHRITSVLSYAASIFTASTLTHLVVRERLGGEGERTGPKARFGITLNSEALSLLRKGAGEGSPMGSGETYEERVGAAKRDWGKKDPEGTSLLTHQPLSESAEREITKAALSGLSDVDQWLKILKKA